MLPGESVEFWSGAMENGRIALAQNNLRYARAFFGCAWELALMYVNFGGSQKSGFGMRHLVDAGDCLCAVLKKVDCVQEAGSCLTLMRDYVMLAAGDSALKSADRQRLLGLYNVVDQRYREIVGGATCH